MNQKSDKKYKDVEYNRNLRKILGLPYAPRIDTIDHPDYMVRREIGLIADMVRLESKFRNPAQSLAKYIQLRNKSINMFKEKNEAGILTPIQKKRFKYYTIDSLDIVVKHLTKQIGSPQNMIAALKNEPGKWSDIQDAIDNVKRVFEIEEN